MKLLKYLAIMAVICLTGCKQKYEYQTVENDPLKTKMYTLDNGLKVYMTVNKEEPRIQTYIAVRVGGKNDPKETTGLAHYFEHLMFKGTESFGTQDFAAEKPYLDKIEELYEEYHSAMETSRNADMLEVAKGYLDSGKTVFFAVGLAHLLGDGGLVQALRDAGYTVTLIQD